MSFWLFKMAEQLKNKEIIDYDGPQRTNTSKVWKHFGFVKEGEIISRTTTTCKICKAVKPYKGGNTSNMAAHLNNFHSDIFNAPKEGIPKVQTNLTSFLGSSKPYPKDGKMHQDLTQCMAELIVKDLVPLSTVESEEFRNLISKLNARYEVPCRQTIRNVTIPKMYAETKIKLMQDIEKHKAFGITTDCWTSVANQSYMTGTLK